MKIKDIKDVVKKHSFKWPGGDIENYDHVVVYNTKFLLGTHIEILTVGTGEGLLYG